MRVPVLDEKLASDLTVEADWARRGLYVGPQFETLEEKVQEWRRAVERMESGEAVSKEDMQVREAKLV